MGTLTRPEAGRDGSGDPGEDYSRVSGAVLPETRPAESPITVYCPHQRAKMGLIATLRNMAVDCITARELIFQLFKRDWLMMYKKSFLGMGWHIAAPIVGILSWLLMNATGVLEPGEVGIPYPAYVLLSTTIWGFFMATFSQTSTVLQIAQSFIQQVGFDHHVLLVKQWLQVFANFTLSLATALVLVSFIGVTPSIGALLFPIALLPMLLLGSAIGLVTSVIQVVVPDLTKAITFLMGFWMYITPVIFSPDVESPLLQTLIKWNPMTYLLGGARSLFIEGSIEDPALFAAAAAISTIAFLAVLRVFYISEQKVIEKMI